MNEPTFFQRKTFTVRAIQITAGNMRAISESCGGVYKTPDNGAPYIIVPSGTRGNTARAYIGDWVTCLTSGNNFRVYKDHVFKEAFRELPADVETLNKAAYTIAQAMTSEASNVTEIYEVALKAARKVLALV
jgi:hypothetical protein